MFRIKICGVTTPKDVQLIALAGADAIGLNFYAASPRYVDPVAAEKIVAGISPKLAKVGVFVNAPIEFVTDTAARLKLDWIQLHGDETPEAISTLRSVPILKAFRLASDGADSVVHYLNECRERSALPSAILLDAALPGEFGGTGQTLDWGAVSAMKSRLLGLPLVLAGGLTPFNVAEAVATASPDAVDVASGVESKPGSKDLMLIRAFVMAANKALNGLAK